MYVHNLIRLDTHWLNCTRSKLTVVFLWVCRYVCICYKYTAYIGLLVPQKFWALKLILHMTLFHWVHDGIQMHTRTFSGRIAWCYSTSLGIAIVLIVPGPLGKYSLLTQWTILATLTLRTYATWEIWLSINNVYRCTIATTSVSMNMQRVCLLYTYNSITRSVAICNANLR